MPAPGEGGEEWALFGQAAGAVQKDKRRAVARLEHADLAATNGDIDQDRSDVHLAGSTTVRPGTARSANGRIQKRWSVS